MHTYKLICYLTTILLLVFGLKNSFGQQLQEDDPSLFHFASSQQMLHGNFQGYDYTESCNQNTKVTSIKFRDYIYVAWIGVIGSLNVACLGSTHQKELLKSGSAIPNVYHGYQDTLGGFAYANYSPAMVVYNDKLYIFYNHSSDDHVKYLAITQEGTVTIAERGDLVGSPAGLINITAYPLPEYDGILFMGRGSDNKHIRLYTVGKRDIIKYQTLQVLGDQTLSDQSLGSVTLCEVSGGRRLIAWTGTDFHLNTAFLNVSTFSQGSTLQDKYTHTDHSSHIDGPVLFRKENADDTDVHIVWRGYDNDTRIWQGVINPDNKNTFQQFSIATDIGVANFTPTLISLNEMITYMFWPTATAADPPYSTRYNVMMAKALDYPYQDWMGKLMKDEHTLKNMVLPGSHNAGMNDVTQVSAFPGIYAKLDLPDFGGCNECGFVTQTMEVKEQMEMGYRYFGINLTNDKFSVDPLNPSPYYDDKNKIHASIAPVDKSLGTSTCQGEGFENLLKNARAFLVAHPKELIIINIKDINGGGATFTSLIDDLNAVLPDFKDIIYQKKYEKTVADLINRPIGPLRGKIILTVADTLLANKCNLIRDVFESSHDNQYRYVNTTNASTAKLIDNQTNFFSNSAYTGSYKRMDWQISLTLEKVLCDLRPLNECMEKPKPGFWHHIAHIANCAGEVVEMGETVVKAFAEPTDPRSLIKIIGWIASAFGNTSLATVQENNKHLYPTVYDMVRNKVIRDNNMVNIVYTEGSDYLYTDLCMQLLTDFNEYDDVNAHNNYIQVASTHTGVTCVNPKSGIAAISVKGGVAPYKYHWLSTGDTTATATGLPEGYHRVRITDAMGHKVTRNVYVSMQIHAHSGLAYSTASKTEVQPYGRPNHYEADCDQLIAKIESDYMTTAVGDSVTTSVWIDEKSTGDYVRRHYQLMPVRNAATATATVTLYFTQQDFDAYNRQGALFQLPANPQDSARMRNLIIWQTPGSTSDGSGLLQTYIGKKKEIFLDVSDVVWNDKARRWEVSFHTEGFGGYFLTTYDIRQKNEWLRADAYVTGEKPVVQWQVAEKNISQYYVEYSFDGKNFAHAGSLVSTGRGQHTYQFSHLTFQKPAASFSPGVVFYRVRQLASDGQVSLSELLPVSLTDSGRLLVYPNPFSTELTIQSNIETTAAVHDITGRVVLSLTLQQGRNQVSVDFLPPGFYIVRTANGESHKLVKAQ